jgi:hypothetical protein
MKIVTTPKVHEDCHWVCDKHPDCEAYTTIRLHGWYGSPFDLEEYRADVCNECAIDLHKMLDKFFEGKVELKEVDLI